MKNLYQNLIFCLTKGMNNYEIADELNISYGYVKKILRFLFKKYRVKSRTELAVLYVSTNKTPCDYVDKFQY